jgi:hypothetical protein
MNQTIIIQDNYSISLAPDPWDKNIKVLLVDDVNKITTALAVWEGGRWKSESYSGLDKFFNIMKRYPKVKRALKGTFTELRTPYEHTKTISKTIKCFKRRFYIEVHKILK